MPSTKHLPGFTLIEIIAVCTVIGVLLAIISPSIGLQVAQAQVSAETSQLQKMAAAAQASFESTDLEGTNLAALPGSIPSGTDPTAFSPSTDPAFVPGPTQASDWYAKLAQQMGFAPVLGEAPLPALQPQVARVLLNSRHNTRFMLVGPENEANQQRFLLVSLMAPPGQLALPALPNSANSQDPADLGLFNDIWNTNWSDPTAALPPTWTAALTVAQVAAWEGDGSSRPRLWELCVQRIVCPKFTLTINNTHPTDTCYVYYNLAGSVAGASAAVPANSGVAVISGLYFGRLIQAYRGASAPPVAQLFSQFVLRDQSEITLQD